MENITVSTENVNNSCHYYLLNNLETLTKYLNNIFANSDKKLFQNLIEETEIILDKCCDNSITYRQKAESLDTLTKSWFDLWGRYKHIVEAIELGYIVDDMTNSLMGYTKLLLGISMVNEEKTGDEEIDSQKVIKGYQLIAETIDVFGYIFSRSELIQFSKNAQKTLLDTTYDLKEYFQESTEKHELIIQLRSYCSLIILRVNEYLKQEEQPFKDTVQPNSSSALWWENIGGTFKDDFLYDEAMKLGQYYRDSNV
ncbi:hypothetical protein WEU38_07475 [Cyanobacterium aponinum AL20118]|uniref:Uncharacterized protein n=1 Tax=Cyanobacterium aponinum AL20115 TaxID=3090662 RepID=A0AAF0ZGM3_9CHRO|nr:hypothetical protein [Cyanobacterium aponinum]WPF90103.1 hypothetical protein SAY89_07495 [Cyanobacterium aponinum AL20115]